MMAHVHLFILTSHEVLLIMSWSGSNVGLSLGTLTSHFLDCTILGLIVCYFLSLLILQTTADQSLSLKGLCRSASHMLIHGSLLGGMFPLELCIWLS